MPCLKPYTTKESPYSKRETPFSKKESPYSKSESPYSKSDTPYSELCLEDKEMKIFQNNEFFYFQNGDQYLIND